MILVTGGAGYIGSHTLHQLKDAGIKAVVLDNLYSGHRWAVPEGYELIVGDMGDKELVSKLIDTHKIDSVIHFAAHVEVEESTKEPIKYYRNNFVGSLNLIDVCANKGVKNFIFSSTCATYGTPKSNPIDENHSTAPISPYGKSKLMTETLLQDVVATKKFALKYVILRYFNVAGARVQGGIGQATPRATQLVKVASEVACGKRDKLYVYGTDYPTPDGTCVRDYIHVDDLANAHILALNYLNSDGKSDIFNCGYGKGYSVKEIIKEVKKASGVDFKVEYVERRAGDPVAIWSDASKVKKVLKWKPKYDDISVICKTAYDWEKSYKG